VSEADLGKVGGQFITPPTAAKLLEEADQVVTV
jgi:hypothetical protein